MADVLGGDARGGHLVVGAVGAVFLAHGFQELVGGVDGGQPGHVVRTAGGRQAGVGAGLAVVHHQLDLARLDAQRLQGLDGVGERADVAALAQILPGVVVGDGAVGVQLQRHFSDIEHPDGDHETAHAQPDAHVPALGPRRFGLGLVLVVDGLGHLKQLGIEILQVRPAVDGEVARLRRVLVAELPGVDAGFLRAHVDERFGGGGDLGHAEPAVRRVEVVVGRSAPAQRLEVGDVVPVEAERRQVEEDGHEPVGPVIERHVVLGGDDLALFVAGDAAVGEGGHALAGGVVELVVAEGQGARHIQVLHGGDHEREGVGADAVAEGRARGVHGHAEVLFGDAAGGGESLPGLAEVVRLALESQHAVGAPVALEGVRLDGEMRLVLRVEAALGRDRSVVEDVGRVLALEDRLLHVPVGNAGVDLDGVGHDGFRIGEVDRQDVQVLLDLLGRRPGVLLGVGRDQSHHVAAPADLLVGDHRELPGGGASLPRDGALHGQAVGALDVLAGEHLDDARHGFGFGGVDADDVGVVSLGQHHGQVGGAGRHLQGDVIAVVGQAGDLGQGGGARAAGAVDLGLALEVVGDVGHGLLAAHDLGGGHDGVHQGFVAGAAADVVVVFEPRAHVFARRRGVLLAAARRPRR